MNVNPDAKIVNTSVSLDETLLQLGRITSRIGKIRKPFSAKIAELLQKHLIETGWLTPDGVPTEKAEQALRAEQAREV